MFSTSVTGPLSKSSVQLWESRTRKRLCPKPHHSGDKVPDRGRLLWHARASEPARLWREAPPHRGAAAQWLTALLPVGLLAALATLLLTLHEQCLLLSRAPPHGWASELPAPWCCVSCLGPAGGRLTPESRSVPLATCCDTGWRDGALDPVLPGDWSQCEALSSPWPHVGHSGEQSMAEGRVAALRPAGHLLTLLFGWQPLKTQSMR